MLYMTHDHNVVFEANNFEIQNNMVFSVGTWGRSVNVSGLLEFHVITEKLTLLGGRKLSKLG